MKNYYTFQNPYILIEDMKGSHHPFHKEYKEKIPILKLNSRPLSCPFAESQKFATKGLRRKIVKEGYCETCFVKFKNYDQHIAEFEHREFAMDDSNYERLDALIYIFNSQKEKESKFHCQSDDSDEIPLSPLLRKTPTMSIGMDGDIYGFKKEMNKIDADTIVFSRLNITDSNSSNNEYVEKCNENAELFVDELFYNSQCNK